MKVLFLTNVPAPYRVKFFNELGKYCDLTVLYELTKSKERDHNWKGEKSETFKEKYLKGIRLRTDAAINISIFKYLDSKKYDIIIVGGYSTPTGMLAIEYMKKRKIKFLLNCDGGMVKNDKKYMYKIKRYFISSASGWLSTGKVCSEYLIHYGAIKEKIYKYPFTSIREKDILKENIDKVLLKKELKIEGEKMLLSVGQFINRKGFDILIKAMEGLDKKISLYIIGGKVTKEYLEIIKTLKLKNIYFLEFMDEKKLQKYYRAADLFTLPTREDIWGLVINEAMAQGLPIVTTDKCVAAMELVTEENGDIVRAGEVEELKNSLIKILSEKKINQKSKISLEKIKKYTIENMAKKTFEIFEKFQEE